MRDATFWWSAKKLDSRLNVEDDENVFEAAVAVILLFAVALTTLLRASVPLRAALGAMMMVAHVVIVIYGVLVIYIYIYSRTSVLDILLL
tara:strand:- start:15662 stop:15931 length:270 start_codon:yes stop_codon:yes gene_type:complete